MKTLIMFILFTLFSCSNKKSESVIHYPSMVKVEWDTSQIKIFDNEIVDYHISYPRSYVYDYILLRADSLVTGQLYTGIPYQIPADNKFHKEIIDGNQIYLKFRKVNP